MYVCMCVYTHIVYTYIYIYAYLYIYIYICICMYMCVQLRTYATYLPMIIKSPRVCIFVPMHVCE